jgi:hypothetical protein
MNTSSLADALDELRLAAQMTGEGSVQAIDAALAQVTKYGCPQSIGPLLLMLNDRAAHDEGMFSLIHAAEAFEDSVYVREFLGALPELRMAAPRWASIVLIRVLNNDGTRADLVRALRDAAPAIKQAAKWLCNKVNERSPTFMSKTLPVLAAAE